MAMPMSFDTNELLWSNEKPETNVEAVLMAVLTNRMQAAEPATAPIDPQQLVAEREDIMSKVFDLVQSLIPDDGSGMPPEVEHQIAGISRAVSLALGIEPEATG
jgi:hypothetical protein